MIIKWKEQNSMDPVPEGLYLVQVLGVKKGESLNGNPTLKWELKIIEGEHKGRHLFENHTLTPKAIWRLSWFVSELGIDVKKIPDMNTDSEEFNKVLSLCKDRTIYVQVTIDSWEGKERNKVIEYAKNDEQADIDVNLNDIPDWVKK